MGEGAEGEGLGRRNNLAMTGYTTTPGWGQRTHTRMGVGGTHPQGVEVGEAHQPLHPALEEAAVVGEVVAQGQGAGHCHHQPAAGPAGPEGQPLQMDTHSR